MKFLPPAQGKIVFVNKRQALWLGAFLYPNGKESDFMNFFKEKSGVEVMVIGKRLIVYDSKANKIGQCKLNNYAWKVKNPKIISNYGVV